MDLRVNMDSRYDVVAIGESLLDCLVREQGSKLVIEGNPGGAPCNVLAALEMLGMKTAFIGKVGKDIFGRFLRDSLKKNGITTSGVVDSNKPTTLAIVSLDEHGDREFEFYREKTADGELTEEDVDESLIDKCSIFHFGAFSMSTEKSEKATKRAVLYARKQKKKVSFDPNLREKIWNNLDDAREAILWGLKYADFVKVSEEEQQFITGIKDPLKGGSKLVQEYTPQLLAVTLGSKGSVFFHNGQVYRGHSYDVKTKDTTGAGDAMWGATLAWILKNTDNTLQLHTEQLEKLSAYANAAGAICTTKYGGISAMPSEQEIQNCVCFAPLHMD